MLKFVSLFNNMERDFSLREYLSGTDLAKVSTNSNYKNEVISELVKRLSLRFGIYVDNPKKISGNGWLSPKGENVPILFLSVEDYDNIGDKLEREIGNYFNVRIKYVDDSFQFDI